MTVKTEPVKPGILIINTPVEAVIHRCVTQLQKELGLPNMSATLTKIIGDYYLGRTCPVGHLNWPET